MQQQKPDDFVLATGESYSVRQFIELAFAQVGRNVAWKRNGNDEVGFNAASGKELVKIDRRYFRPTEVDELLGEQGTKGAGLEGGDEFRRSRR